MKAKINQHEHKIIGTIHFDSKDGSYEPLPESLANELKEYLYSQNIEKLYTHQYQMFLQALDGKDIIISTSTASGKTLAFVLPIVQRILNDSSLRVLLIYPTKALAQDQYRNIQPFLDYFGADRIQAGVYDGDTPPNERNRIRQQANLILTNPEMLHGSFLPNHTRYGFNDIFAKLKFVVLDELHVYRGAFGSHMANVIRRLTRVCNYYKSTPQFLLSSATIANPVELAQNICHRTFAHISENGAPQYMRDIILWQPPFVGDSPYRKSPEEEAAEFIPDLVASKDRFIAFCKSRREVEVVLKEARDHLTNVVGRPSLSKNLADMISGYRGGYTKKERQKIEKKLTTGQLKGVIATNALELGIDIGDIEVVLLCGFPSTKASFWQQVGRAGRKGNSLAILFLDIGSVDQYISIHNQYLTDMNVENAIIDKDNLFIQLAHLRAAAAELPLTLGDAAIFPNIGEAIPVLLEAEELKNEFGNFHWTGAEYPAGDFSLRNTSQETYKVIQEGTGTMIAEMDKWQAFHEAYPKAIYIHDGLQYMVKQLDLEQRIAFVAAINVNYFTVPFVEADVAIIKEFKNKENSASKVTFGDVRIRESVVAYKMVQFHNHQNLGYENIELSLVQELETEAIWYSIPTEVVKVFENHKSYNFYRGLEHSLLRGAMMRTMGTSEDMSGTFFSNVHNNNEKKSYILLYDLYPGGLGFTEKAFDFAFDILDNAISIVGNCSCEYGCPACVGDYYLDKKIVGWGLKSLKESTPAPRGISKYTSPQIPKEQKEFTLSDFSVSANWNKFINKLIQKKEVLSDFLQQITKVEVKNNILNLHVNSDFIANWILDSSNKKRIEKTIAYYTEIPEKFTIQVTGLKKEEDTIEKIMHRYDDLKKNKK